MVEREIASKVCAILEYELMIFYVAIFNKYTFYFKGSVTEGKHLALHKQIAALTTQVVIPSTPRDHYFMCAACTNYLHVDLSDNS